MKNIDFVKLFNLLSKFFDKGKVTLVKLENNRFEVGEYEITFHVSPK